MLTIRDGWNFQALPKMALINFTFDLMIILKINILAIDTLHKSQFIDIVSRSIILRNSVQPYRPR